LSLFFSRYGTPLQWLWVFLMAALFAGTGVYLFNPSLATGAGLSAVLHGLFLFGALHEIRHQPLSGYVLLALLCGKLAWEFLFGSISGAVSLASGRVATDAHFYGALGAGTAAAVLALLGRKCHAGRVV
jgi:rhomboid family GlyGly-CTERM serine protease